MTSPGLFKPKRDGERHAFDVPLAQALHRAVTVPDAATADGAGFPEGYDRWLEYRAMVDAQGPMGPRDLVEPHRPAGVDPVPLDDVEPASSILRRCSTGAISFGAISREAHEDLAVALRRLGARSNSGEGGEDPTRAGTERASAIKQVASGRFGVTPAYLRAADELQIKVAQGSKPGEGGQLPGHKVTAEIAAVRHTVPGVGLISPPPHHDVYSIEDLAQLVHDLSSVNPRANVSVKLVSQAGVGTIAVGVVKSRADVVQVSGASGGTGASPLGSIKHAGAPWETGLAETHQVLVGNGLRGRVRLRTDGGLRTGRDLFVALALGADEFSFGTQALVAEGCLMARTCHNDSCPVGIATQDPALRAKYPGSPERVMALLSFAVHELRLLMADLGVRDVSDIVGRTDLLRPRTDVDAHGLDVSRLLAVPDVNEDVPRRWNGGTNRVPGLDDTLDARVAAEARPLLDALDTGAAIADLPRIEAHHPITTADRSVGARLGGDLAVRPAALVLPRAQVHVRFDGSAGQSFGAFAAGGVTLELRGEANDYVGKGLAGAEVAVAPTPGSTVAADPPANQVAGNACLYGATSGAVFLAGRAGARFAVRNSGADAVVEGVGDHAGEYMTGGTVVVLGRVGRNVGAGMSGGRLLVLDATGTLAGRVNPGLVHVAVPTPDDLAAARALVERHVELTASVTAAAALADWPTTAAALRAVVPRPTVVPTTAPATATTP